MLASKWGVRHKNINCDLSHGFLLRGRFGPVGPLGPVILNCCPAVGGVWPPSQYMLVQSFAGLSQYRHRPLTWK